MKKVEELSKEENHQQEVSTDFLKLSWHDSELINFHILKNISERKFDIELDLDLVVGFSQGDYEREKTKLIFKNCYFTAIDFDLKLMGYQNGAINAASCYKNISELTEEEVRKFEDIYDIRLADLIKDCLCFHIEMIAPSGTITIIANNFAISKDL